MDDNPRADTSSGAQPDVLDHHDDEGREVVIALIGAAALVALILLVFAVTLQVH